MSEEQRKILEILAAGKIKVEEAEQLLNAVQAEAEDKSTFSRGKSQGKPKYLIINVYSAEDEEGKPRKVNVRVPMQMLQAGVKLASLMPAIAKTKVNQALNQKGMQFDLDNLRYEDLKELVDAMADMTVDVNEGKERVRVYCE